MHCCGYCGQPTDENGKPIQPNAEFDNSKAEMVHGMCCADQAQYENERRIITKEMASDAGMPEIEGSTY